MLKFAEYFHRRIQGGAWGAIDMIDNDWTSYVESINSMCFEEDSIVTINAINNDWTSYVESINSMFFYEDSIVKIDTIDKDCTSYFKSINSIC